MKNVKLKKVISLTASLIMMFNLCGFGFEGSGFSFPAQTVSVQAAGTVCSGCISGQDVKEVSDANNDSDVLLYFKLNKNNKTASLCGSKIKNAGKNVVIPNTVEVTSNNTTVKYTVTSISDSAFEGQTNLKSLNIKPIIEGRGGTVYASVSSIGSCAFKNCANLEYFYIQNTSIESNAFQNCINLTGVDLSKTNSIGEYAFSNCTSLQSVEYNGRYINKYAFQYCNKLEIVNMQKASVITVEQGAFMQCTSLKRVYLSNTLKVIGKRAFYGIGAEIFDIPESVESIGEEAFCSCYYLKTVITPTGLKEIGKKAFYDNYYMDFFVCENSYIKFGEKAVGYFKKSDGTDGKNGTLVIWGSSQSGTDYNYAKQNGFYHKLKKTAAANALNELNSTKYNFTNAYSTINFADSNGNYYIDSRQKYLSTGLENEKWEGSCYGMSSLYVLVRNGIITDSTVTKNYQKNTNNIISLINTLHSKRVTGNSFMEPEFISDFYIKSKTSASSEKVFGRSMLKYIEYITYGADLGVLTYSCHNNIGAHAVVCFGMENKSDASDSQSDLWKDSNDINANARILIYDVDNSGYNTKYNIYVNKTTGKWYMKDTFGFYMDYQSYQSQMQLNCTADRMYDTKYSLSMSSEDFIDKAVRSLIG